MPSKVKSITDESVIVSSDYLFIVTVVNSYMLGGPYDDSYSSQNDA